MKAAIFAISALALCAIAQPARSETLRMSGGQFLSLCADPPRDRGVQVAAMCRMYVAGIADALQTSHQICVGPRVGMEKLFNASMWWIESRPRDTFAAGLMIRNGLLRAFPCRVAAMNRRMPASATLDQNLERLGKFTAFMKEAMTLLKMFGV